MCVMSMVCDHYRDKWVRYEFSPVLPSAPTYTYTVPQVTKEEFNALKKDVEEMKLLLKRAKEYDERTGQADCEMEEKVALVKKVAELVGVDLGNLLG